MFIPPLTEWIEKRGHNTLQTIPSVAEFNEYDISNNWELSGIYTFFHVA